MKVAVVSVANDIIAIGFRKIAAIARQVYPSTEVYYVVSSYPYSALNYIMPTRVDKFFFSDKELADISEHLALFDMVCFSSMTYSADLTKAIITNIRKINANVYIVLGGVHSIVYPDDAIQFADAICVGEGERAFKEFFSAYINGLDFTNTKNFWFNQKGSITKNSFFPLSTPQEIETFPFPIYAERELIYSSHKRGFTDCGLSDYLAYNDLSYNTVWSIGCPNKCTYCSNSKFIENDKNYRILRYPSVEYIITEIEGVFEKHPHISKVNFHDDSFMAIPYKAIELFASQWKERIGLPFYVTGLIPSYVKRDKMAVLIEAGMNQVRMGIQSGSDRILAFYKRPNPAGIVFSAASIITEFKEHLILPSYDIIMDNPIETREDILATLEMAYMLPRPYTLNLFSLRAMPNTELAHEFERLNVNLKDLKDNYSNLRPTFANLLMRLLVLFKPPQWLFQRFLRRVKPFQEKQTLFPILHVVLRILCTLKVVISRVLVRDFAHPATCKVGYLLWKMGLIKFTISRKIRRI
ncbi:MAG: B12-binding domain-containing radical SAM protein [Nitrospirae bacterium]|nr:B12-binding domain-containing radical SAM protein [Nitrospirota bacterium]